MSAPQPPDAPEREQTSPVAPLDTAAGRFGVILTNLAKLAGIIGGIHEAAGPARYSAILFWVALFLGAQALEDLLTKMIDRAMGR